MRLPKLINTTYGIGMHLFSNLIEAGWADIPSPYFGAVELNAGSAALAIVQKVSDTHGSVYVISYMLTNPLYKRKGGNGWH